MYLINLKNIRNINILNFLIQIFTIIDTATTDIDSE